MEGFERFQLAGLALLCKNATRQETEDDLKALIADASNDDRERQRRERLLNHLVSSNNVEPLELARYSLDRAQTLVGTSNSGN